MPNILINSACNKNCSFCFESDYKKRYKNVNMSLEDFRKVLEFSILSHRNEEYVPIQILGGEPLVHPQFGEILDMLTEYSLRYPIRLSVITNGIELKKYIDFFFKNNDAVSLLLNVTENLQTVKEVLQIANDYNLNYVPSITITKHLDFEIVEYIINNTSHSNNIIRACVGFDSCDNVKEYYNEIKPLLFKTYQMITDAGFNISTDCIKIPGCLFTEDELKQLEKFNIQRRCYNEFNAICPSNMDILPDLKVSLCMPLYDKNDEISINDFSTIAEIRNYLDFSIRAKKMYERLNNNTCQNCKIGKTYNCSVGCLGMTMDGFI